MFSQSLPAIISEFKRKILKASFCLEAIQVKCIMGHEILTYDSECTFYKGRGLAT